MHESETSAKTWVIDLKWWTTLRLKAEQLEAMTESTRYDHLVVLTVTEMIASDRLRIELG